MYDNYNYPAGADTPSAPWNQQEQSEKEFDVIVTPYLQTCVTITTSDYNGYYEELDPEDGGSVYYTDTSDTNWDKAYRECEFTIPEMLAKLKEYVERDIERLKEQGAKSIPWELRYLLQSCQGWEEVDNNEYELN